MRRWLILSHRYLGIALGGLVILWFASGIGMIYAGGMPELTDRERIRRSEPLDMDAVGTSPSEAMRVAGGSGTTRSVTLLTVGSRPAYRVEGRRPRTIFADDGQIFAPVDSARAREIAARFVDVESGDLRYERLLTRADQWTISVRGRLPLHEFAVDDPAGTEVYVSAGSGEVAQLTTRRERMLAWVAAIPHWLYFTPLRVRDGLWTQVILWTSGLGCVLVALGLALGIVQIRSPRSPGDGESRRRIPYRGLLRWHYLAGAVFGVFALTWVFSGFLSMEPGGWAAGEAVDSQRLRETLAGGAVNPSAFPPVESVEWDALLPGRVVKTVEYTRILGDPHFVVRSVEAASGGETLAPGVETTLVAADPVAVRNEPFPVDILLDRVERAYPETPVEKTTVLEEYDAYHYDREGRAALPVLRVELDEPSGTWLYLDPASATLARTVHRLDRVERWIYHGFHSLDFDFWYDRRPLWDVGVIVLLLGGLATSGIGVYLGGRRILRRTRGSAR